MDVTFSIFIIRVSFFLDFPVQNFNIPIFKFEKNRKYESLYDCTSTTVFGAKEEIPRFYFQHSSAKT